jgi:hypothetical protein
MSRDRGGIRRMMPAFAGLLVWLAASPIGPTGHANAASRTFAYEDAVTFCRGRVMRPIAFNDDGSILCFDGYIYPDRDYSLAEKLKDHGLFVVRTTGGDIEQAISLARVIHDRHATVVVYDYCVSACAVYLLTATDQAVVRKASLVTWHLRPTGCYDWVPIGDDRIPGLRASLCFSVSERNRAFYRGVEVSSAEWLGTRTVAPNVFGRGLDAPQSKYVRMTLTNLVSKTGDFPYVFWTWNPRFYRAVFRTNIVYEAYPESQAEVDALSARFGLGRVIFDP